MSLKISKNKRSEIMKKIKSKDSKIEVEFRKSLWKEGFRYRKNVNKFFGKPDLVLKKYKTVIFIDSCFWHGCRRHRTIPKTNVKYWKNKIERNRQRDREVGNYYRRNGWKVIRIWEHNLKNVLNTTIKKITK